MDYPTEIILYVEQAPIEHAYIQIDNEKAISSNEKHEENDIDFLKALKPTPWGRAPPFETKQLATGGHPKPQEVGSCLASHGKKSSN